MQAEEEATVVVVGFLLGLGLVVLGGAMVYLQQRLCGSKHI